MSKLRELLSQSIVAKVDKKDYASMEENIEEVLKTFRQMIEDSGDDLLKSWRFQDEFLLRFIRGKKYKLKSAFEKLQNNVIAKRHSYPEIFEVLYPSALRSYLDKQMMRILKHRDNQGSHIVIFKPENYDPQETLVDDLLRVQILVTWEMMSFKETQLNGIVIIVDGSGFSTKQIKVVTPYNAQKYVTLAVKCSPTRFKGCYVVFLPQVLHFGVQMVRALLPEKVRNRMVSFGSNMDEFYKLIPQSILPIGLGGSLTDDEAIDYDLENALLGKDAYYKDLIQ
ncbi:Alpha-tocopherol transfer protein-like [Orchesella cincta]|uniref:Alpha-tocopherol transfer protein-like n=1 Tax=Orchesella cincta TaxID=48709 RepID=A0A1D2MNH5_ORCCI|nr:Alpha-tocopherol transfer protein-like [Orchesella cincta]